MKGPGERKPEGALLRRLVERLRVAFYPETIGADALGMRPFYEDLKMLRMAACYGAVHVRENGTGEFDEERYEEIFAEVVAKVRAHGPGVAKMRRRSAYVLQAVQDHWRHHWEEYQPESKTAAVRVEAALRELVRRGECQPAGDLRPMALLARVHDELRTGRPRKAGREGKGPAQPGRGKGRDGAREIQEELFG